MAIFSAAGCSRAWTRPAASAAVERAKGRAVTIAVEAMTFIRPVKVGDVLEVYTDVESIGRTSMKIHIEAWVRRFQTHADEKVTDATFTFVAIDENGKPRPIPEGMDGRKVIRRKPDFQSRGVCFPRCRKRSFCSMPAPER